ncbi:MAG: RNA polymerase II transcription factor B subunit 4 [Chaenotheca gracillima]|nr:MAG: RNA polymerase II transcription factor B subunit 4 [Chaenotheca gracillima]
MVMLKAGGTAVDGVEMAIKVLEDRIITNAGYGSNLSMDGTVECDATVVDNCGRSGAVGAVSQIKNPISLARLILETSLREMTLRRIPPNLLVAEGAVDFAAEHGLPIMPHDFLVSDGARQRYLKWKIELDRAEAEKNGSSSPGSLFEQHGDVDLHFEEYARQRSRADHVQVMRDAVYRKKFGSTAQGRSDEVPDNVSEAESQAFLDWNAGQLLSDEFIDPIGPPGLFLGVGKGGLQDSMHVDSSHSFADPSGSNQPQQLRQSPKDAAMPEMPESGSAGPDLNTFVRHDGPSDSSSSSISSQSLQLPSLTPSPQRRLSSDARQPLDSGASPEGNQNSPSSQRTKSGPTEARNDFITDTVGVIAVDSFGRIAAGSSSGGIGMKHRGRVGPAALVGIGSSVIPLDPDDKEQTSVASVTSGTGEHIATTMAASVCAERLYNNVKKNRRGRLEPASEESIMQSFIKKDFMDHPSVKFSSSEGAIGVMAVKKCKDGIYTYFAHNTESFALASMHSDEQVPVCTMSRINGEGGIAQGARGIKRRHKSLRANHEKNAA